MNEREQRLAADENVHEFRAEFPGTRRRRIVASLLAALVVIAFAVCSLFMVQMHNSIDHLNATVAHQQRQIGQLRTDLRTVDSDLSAAVACLQTIGAQQGLCTKLVK